jgi:putative tryptophan/tyrosine transport system substrate-binding protein
MNDPQAEGHLASYIGRRKLLAALGGAAVAWPPAARAQQPAMPVVGFLSVTPRQPDLVAVVLRDLAEAGYFEGRISCLGL